MGEYTPAQLAERWGVSERALRRRARELGACRVIGKGMWLNDDDVRTRPLRRLRSYIGLQASVIAFWLALKIIGEIHLSNTSRLARFARLAWLYIQTPPELPATVPSLSPLKLLLITQRRSTSCAQKYS
jgi:hypothetical protein